MQTAGVGVRVTRHEDDAGSPRRRGVRQRVPRGGHCQVVVVAAQVRHQFEVRL